MDPSSEGGFIWELPKPHGGRPARDGTEWVEGVQLKPFASTFKEWTHGQLGAAHFMAPTLAITLSVLLALVVV